MRRKLELKDIEVGAVLISSSDENLKIKSVDLPNNKIYYDPHKRWNGVGGFDYIQNEGNIDSGVVGVYDIEVADYMNEVIYEGSTQENLTNGKIYKVVKEVSTSWVQLIDENGNNYDVHRSLLSDPAQTQIGGTHYNKNDPIQFARDNYPKEQLEGFFRINVDKYVARYDKKNGLEDLKKAKHYLDMLIELKDSKNAK